MSWIDSLFNARGNYLKKAIFEILQEKFMNHENIIERISGNLQTESDYNSFLKLIAEVYEVGYIKAVKDHQQQLQKIGLIATIKKEQ